MSILPYNPNKGLKKFGIALLLIGIIGFSFILISFYYSGKTVASAGLTKPIDQTSLVLQNLQAEAQSKLQNTMNKLGVFSLKTDLIERLDVTFQPLRLTKDMGEVTLIFDIQAQGIYDKNTSPHLRKFGETYYKLTEQDSGDIVFEKRSDANKFDVSGEGVYSLVDHTHKNSGTMISSGGGYTTLTNFVVPKDGNYVLEARLEKLKYSYPVTDLTLIAKTGMDPYPSIPWLGSLFGLIILGYIILLIGTPLDKRISNKERNRARQKNN
jgi:hypothetical protein